MEREEKLLEAQARVDALTEAVAAATDSSELRRLRLELYRAEQAVLNLRRSREPGSTQSGRKAAGGTLGGKVKPSTGKYGIGGYASLDNGAYAAWASKERDEEMEAAESAKKHLQQAILYSALKSAVTPRQREMMLMYFRGLNMREIGEILGVDKSTVSRTVTRGLRNAKKISRTMEAAVKYTEDKDNNGMSSMMAEVEIFTRAERLAMTAAANRVPIGGIANLLDMDIDGAQEIIRTAQAKVRGETTQRNGPANKDFKTLLGEQKGSKFMELKKYVNEIIDIAKANGMAWDIGKDMFVANIQNHGVEGAPYYAGADGFDYGALQAEWNALSIEEKGASKNAFDDWYRENMDVIIAARKAGMRVIPE